MEQNTEFLEQIDRFVSGEMTGSERQAFEDKMAQDANLRNEVEAYINLYSGFAGLEFDMFEKQVASWEAKHKTQKTGKTIEKASGAKIVSFKKYYQIAAAILIIVLPLSFFMTNYVGNEAMDHNTLFVEHFAVYPNMVGERSEGKADPYKTKGLQAYSFGDYKAAIANFEKFLQTESDVQIQFYLGVAQLAENRAEDAHKTLSKVIKHSDSNFIDLAEWYDALAIMRSGNVAKAKEQLNAIARNPGHDKSVIARKLLKQLSKDK